MNKIWNGELAELAPHLRGNAEWDAAYALPLKCHRWTVGQVLARIRNTVEQASRRRPEAHGVGA